VVGGHSDAATVILDVVTRDHAVHDRHGDVARGGGAPDRLDPDTGEVWSLVPRDRDPVERRRHGAAVSAAKSVSQHEDAARTVVALASGHGGAADGQLDRAPVLGERGESATLADAAEHLGEIAPG